MKFKKLNITFYHCDDCQYIFKSPKYYQTLHEQESRYDLHDNNENSKGYKAYFERFLDFILPNVKDSTIALDFGCGTTTLLSQMLEKNGIPCDYYDPIYYPNRLDETKKYDLIVSTEVFEHLHHPRKVFKSLVDRLHRGGYLAIQTQFHANDKESFENWYYHKDPTHIVFYTKKSFEVLANMYGCEVLVSNEKNMVILRKNA